MSTIPSKDRYWQWFHQSSNGPVQTGTVQSSPGPVQEIFGPGSDRSPIFRGLDWAGLDCFRPAHSGRIGPNTLAVTDTLSQQIDSYTHTHTCRLILPFTILHIQVSARDRDVLYSRRRRCLVQSEMEMSCTVGDGDVLYGRRWRCLVWPETVMSLMAGDVCWLWYELMAFSHTGKFIYILALWPS
jgi:hypothetical protein